MNPRSAERAEIAEKIQRRDRQDRRGFGFCVLRELRVQSVFRGLCPLGGAEIAEKIQRRDRQTAEALGSACFASSAFNPFSAVSAPSAELRSQRRFNAEDRQDRRGFGLCVLRELCVESVLRGLCPSADANVGTAYRIQPPTKDPIMRYVTFSLPTDRTERLGVVRGDRVFDAGQYCRQPMV